MGSEITYNWLIMDALTRFSDRVAFVAGDRKMTYREAVAVVAKFVAILEAHGVKRGTGVAVLSSNAPEAWLAQVATYLVGGRFTPLQILGSIDDHVYICNDAEVGVVLVEDKLLDHGEELKARVSTVNAALSLSTDAVGPIDSRNHQSWHDATRASNEEVAWLQYTGGSTGRPKGVMLSQQSLVQQTFSHLASWGIPEEPRYLAAGSITHASGLPVVPTLLRGGTVVLMSAFDPSAWLHLVEAERINYAFVVPTMLYSLLDEPSLDAKKLSTLQTVNYGAAPMAPSRLKEGIDRIGPVFQEVYGQTEVLGVGTTLRRDEHDVDDLELLTSCGRSVAGAEVQVLNESMERVEAGEVGELCIRTRAAMIGYHNLPEESAHTLRNGWVRTGDMARQDDRGFFYLVDRKKDMIVSGGYNVFSREVESALETHPAVKDVAVIAIPDEKWGEAVCAVVVRRSSVTTSEPQLIAHVRSSKGSVYAPKKIVFADDLPMTALGKVDKKALREPYWNGHTRSIH